MSRKALLSVACLMLLAAPLTGQADETTTTSQDTTQQTTAAKAKSTVKPVTIINSGNGSVYAPGTYGVILKYTSISQDDYYSGSDSVSYVRSSSSTMKAKERSVDKTVLTLRAGIMKNIDARVIIPYLNKDLDRENATKSISDSNSGIGDIKVIGRYQIMSQKQKDPFNLAVGIGLKMPTGETDYKDKSTGNTAGYLQPGSGSWDPIFELGAHKIMGRHWFSTSYEYQLTTEGELGSIDIEKSDTFKYNAAYAYAVCKFFDVELELNGEVTTKAEKDGVKQANTGGHVLYVTPGVHFKLMKGTHLDFGVALPIYRDLNGTQLAEDYRFITKLAVKF